jgi:hypothetical protein
MTTAKLTQSDLDQFTGSENWCRHGQKMFEVIPPNPPGRNERVTRNVALPRRSLLRHAPREQQKQLRPHPE